MALILAKPAAVLCLAAVVGSLLSLPLAAQARSEDDPILAQAEGVVVRRSDYELELLRIPENHRFGFTTDKTKVIELVNRMLIARILTKKAEADGLTKDPEQLRNLEREAERFWAEAYLSQVAATAAQRFDARAEANEARARELYKVDVASRWTVPESVLVSHILVETGKRSDDEARSLAVQARTRALAGQDFAELARSLSDDPSAKRNGGRIGIVQKDRYDPAFAKVAYALKDPGEISMPVRSAFGWHIIKLESRQPPRVIPYEEARPKILEAMKADFVKSARDSALAAAQNDRSIRIDEQAIAKLFNETPAPKAGTPAAPRGGG